MVSKIKFELITTSENDASSWVSFVLKKACIQTCLKQNYSYNKSLVSLSFQ